MRKEVVDKRSGAILFKKTKETKDLENLIQKVSSLEEKLSKLEKKMNKLSSNKKEDS